MEREWYQHYLELSARVKLLMMVILHFECSRNKRGLVPIDYATTDEMRAILSASTLKTCSQGSTQLRILSLPENGKVSLNANENEKHEANCEKNVSNVVEEVSFWCQCSDVEWPFFLFLF